MGSHRRAIVLDANILIRAVLGPRVRNLILDNRHHVHFFTPGICIDDARHYLPELLARRGMDPAPALELLELLLAHIDRLDDAWLEDHEATAQLRLRHRDPDDWPVLAGAMALACPIWTQDTDFFGVGVATWTTEHIAAFFAD
jgi:predicted nucleic acid-binding protein